MIMVLSYHKAELIGKVMSTVPNKQRLNEEEPLLLFYYQQGGHGVTPLSLPH